MPSTSDLRDWTDSVAVNSLTGLAERFFARLIMKVDAFGRINASPKLLRAKCFPLLIDSVREADISRWIAECENAGLIVLYEADSKTVLTIVKYGGRLYYNSTSEFPDPPEHVEAVSRFSDRPPPKKGEKFTPGLRGVTRRNAASSALCPLPSAPPPGVWGWMI